MFACMTLSFGNPSNGTKFLRFRSLSFENILHVLSYLFRSSFKSLPASLSAIMWKVQYPSPKVTFSGVAVSVTVSLKFFCDVSKIPVDDRVLHFHLGVGLGPDEPVEVDFVLPAAQQQGASSYFYTSVSER